MAINLGALVLELSSMGTEKVLRDVHQVDAAAKRAGAKPTHVKVDTIGATKAKADLGAVVAATEAVERNTTQATVKANALAAAWGKAATAARAASVAGMGGAAAGVGRGAKAGGGAMAGMGLAGMGAGLVGGAVAGVAVAGVVALGATMAASADAVDRHQVAQGKLQAASRATGIAMADLNRIADENRQRFHLSAAGAMEVTDTVVRLTSLAGQVGQSGDFATAWMDLAAARGLNATQAMEALEVTIRGQDEGLNKLGLQDPGQIYKKWGAGTDQASRSQAILNEVLERGAAQRGTYQAWLETAPGKVHSLQVAQDALALSFGTAILPLRMMLVEGLTVFTEWMVANMPTIIAVAKTIGNVLAPAFHIVGDAIATVVDIGLGAWGYLVGGILAGVEKMLSGMASLFGGVASLAGKLGLSDYSARLGGEVAGLRKQAATVGGLAASNLAMGQRADARLKRRMGPFNNVRSGSGVGARPTGAGAVGAAGLTTGGTRTTGSGARATPVGMPLGNVLAGQTGPALSGLTSSGLTSATGIQPVRLEVPLTIGFRTAVEKIKAEDLKIAELAAETQSHFDSLGANVTGIFGNVLGTAMSDGWGAAGNVALQGLGNIMVQMGQAMLLQGATMMGLLPALMNPFTSGPALLAAGAVLIGLGATLGGIAGGRGGKGGGRSGGAGRSAPAFGNTSRNVTLGSGKTAPGMVGDGKTAVMQPVQVNQTIIGSRDSRAFREITEGVRRATGRNISVTRND